MKGIHLWKGSSKLQKITEAGAVFGHLKPLKIQSGVDSIVMLDSSQNIWVGKISLDLKIQFESVYISAHDFICVGKHIYFVNGDGKVFKSDLTNMDIISEVVLFEDANSCPHGNSTCSQHISVKYIAIGTMGILFISNKGHLWAFGEQPQLNVIKECGPTKVSFFEGRNIISANSGKDFSAIITHKRDCISYTTIKDDFKDNESTNNCVTSCQQCMNENILPLSPQNCFDTCPLGLPSNSPSSSTPTSKNNTIASEEINDADCVISSSTEEDSCLAIKNKEYHDEINENNDHFEVKVEKIDGIGLLHINTESARQFLTRQLSWVSSGGEELLAEVSVPTKIIKQNVSTVASFVYEGVKTVGDKVVTLSRHMSGGSDNLSDSFDDFAPDEYNLSHASNTSSVK